MPSSLLIWCIESVTVQLAFYANIIVLGVLIGHQSCLPLVPTARTNHFHELRWVENTSTAFVDVDHRVE